MACENTGVSRRPQRVWLTVPSPDHAAAAVQSLTSFTGCSNQLSEKFRGIPGPAEYLTCISTQTTQKENTENGNVQTALRTLRHSR